MVADKVKHLREQMSMTQASLAKQLGISERTLKIAKRNLGILSERRADQWLWRLPEQEGKGVTP